MRQSQTGKCTKAEENAEKAEKNKDEKSVKRRTRW